MSLTKLIGNKQDEYNRAKSVIVRNPELKAHYNLDEIKSELDRLEQRHKELLAKKSQLKGALMTYAKYLELFESIAVKLREKHDMAVLDQLLRKFFTNLNIRSYGKGKEQRYEIDYKLKEPWVGFLQTENFVRGRG